ncbi:MAG: histidine phosphatase family protein [Caulobacteraceae bacterium]
MARIWLIRHARPSAAWGGEDDDPGLDGTGRTQAVAAAKALLALPAGDRATSVVSSPLRRCRQTAEPLAAALGLAVDIDPAVGEIPTPRDLAHDRRGPWLRTALAGQWADIAGDLDYEAWRRAVCAAVAGRPGAAIFSHFVAINAVVSLLAGEDRVIGFRPDHASITILELGGGGLELVERGAEAATAVL